ncbi:hypothetical protein ACHAW5_008938 [Stephanodiscus triporus]|uniref:F-box domain-containing protein n=1 Tax=Stephanodiscus triporus TaxID=2934178 RepID=A0ABD3MZ23_9STRA
MSPLLLPKDAWRDVSSFLDAPDVMNLLSAHRDLHVGLGRSRSFWLSMLARERDDDDDNDDDNDDRYGGGHDSIADVDGNDDGGDDGDFDDHRRARREYVLRAYQRRLPAVRWHGILDPRTPSPSNCSISAREGHLACAFVEGDGGEMACIVTGGFTDDVGVYVLRGSSRRRGGSRPSSAPPLRGWVRLEPTGDGVEDFVYGASLTAIDSTRAVRFGGFRSGGYSDECNDLTILTLVQSSSSQSSSCRWERVRARNPHLAAPRAYHSATLLGGRYLVVIGGMTRWGSVVSAAVLDTRSWTWLDVGAPTRDAPAGRHGHSVVLDGRRNRLVLFGGGSGTDLLRTGEDSSEVWELKMGDGWDGADLMDSLPWTWRRLHRDIYDDEGEEADFDPNDAATRKLSSSEALCLGRCHCGLKISPDTAICLMGSGSPSTNGVVAYNLSTDAFVRPLVLGSLPKPRFTFACAALGRGYVLVHGGYSSQDDSALGDSIESSRSSPSNPPLHLTAPSGT